jgi:hypothetical protein
MAGKNVVKKKESMPALAETYEGFDSMGFENATADSYAIPFLAILQSNSPQVKKTSGSYIDGATEGMLLNTVQNTVLEAEEEGVLVIPVAYRQGFVEWIPRDQGGGFVQEYLPHEAPRTERDDDNRDVLPNGNELIDTRYHSVLLMNEDGTASPIVIAMTRTQVKKSKRWMSLMQDIKFPKADGSGTYTPPMFSHVYRLKVVPEQKDEYSWWNWDVTKERIIEDGAIVAQAKKFHDAIAAGEVREATDSQTAAAGDDTESAPSF